MEGRTKLSNHRLITLDVSQLDAKQRASFANELKKTEGARLADESLVFIDMSKLSDDERTNLTSKLRDLSRKIDPAARGRVIAEAWMVSVDDTIDWF